MKNITTSIVLGAILLTACAKDETQDAGPTLPVVRHLYATFSTVNNDALEVRITRATQSGYAYTWANTDGQEYTLATQGGQQESIYRSDRIEFIGTVNEPHSITVRIDDIQTFTVNLDPSMNGQPAYQITADW